MTGEHGGDVWSHPGVSLDFSVSLHPLGMPEPVKATLRAGVAGWAAYPDPLCRELTAAVAAREGVPESFVVCGNGASDLIYRLCLALRPRRVGVLAPTFSDYRRAAGLVGAATVSYPLAEADGFAVPGDAADWIRPGTDVVFWCQPNNPTGRLTDFGVLRGVVERCGDVGAVAVVDECFLPFTTGESLVGWTARYPHLVVLRAFTKLYAMAGLRLGYLVSADAGLVARARDAGSCWSVNSAAQAAGLAALAVAGWAEAAPGLVAAEREYLTGELAALGHTVYPSDANFLLIRSASPVTKALEGRGLLVRDCSNFEGLDERHWRIGVKTRSENELLVGALTEISGL